MSSGRQLLPQDNSMPPIWGVDGSESTLDVIVFSKNRACQLDALLRSMREFFEFPHRIHVLYSASTDKFEIGYNWLRRWHRGIDWVGEEGSFREAMIDLMARIDRGPGRYLMFLVDDMIFTRTFTAQTLMESLDDDDDILAVSLRMGENITYCYVRDIQTEPPDFSNGFHWEWRTASPGYWDYPMSQDAHIFRTSDFSPLLKPLNFDGPNSLEVVQSRCPFPRPDLICEQTPSVINIAANRVGEFYKNRSGNITAEFLDESFHQGKAIDVRSFTGQIYNSCHIEVDLPLIEDSRTRALPGIKKQNKAGKAHYLIDLHEIPTFVINCREDIDRRDVMQRQLTELNLNFDFVRGMRTEPAWIGVALAHLRVLRLLRARPPFLILEDDCLFNDHFRHELEIPTEAEALYLGVSSYGIAEPGKIGWGGSGETLWRRYDAHYLRVAGQARRALSE